MHPSRCLVYSCQGSRTEWQGAIPNVPSSHPPSLTLSIQNSPPPRWPIWLASKYEARRILWLAIIWALLFLLAVGLLVGLLVPWNKTSSTFTGPQGSLAQIGTAGPTSASFNVCRREILSREDWGLPSPPEVLEYFY